MSPRIKKASRRELSLFEGIFKIRGIHLAENCELPHIILAIIVIETIQMFGERRRYKRYSINRIAKFVTESGGLPRDCMIVNISEDGARLYSEASDVPDNFVLLISGEKAVREECSVVWRLGNEIGVTFVTRERTQARLNTMKEVQSQVRNVFRQ